LAAKFGNNFLVLHQLTGKSAKCTPGRKPQWFDAAEATSFAWEVHQCFAIGTATKAGRCFLVASKNHGGPKGDCVMHMDGVMNRFDSLDPDVVYTWNENKQELTSEEEDDRPDALMTPPSLDTDDIEVASAVDDDDDVLG
jgi:hypothetical protein